MVTYSALARAFAEEMVSQSSIRMDIGDYRCPLQLGDANEAGDFPLYIVGPNDDIVSPSLQGWVRLLEINGKVYAYAMLPGRNQATVLPDNPIMINVYPDTPRIAATFGEEK